MKDFRKLTEANVKHVLAQKTGPQLTSEMEALQVAVYTMVGGGWLGHSAAHSPKGFYVDGRVSRRPYALRAILQAVRVLELYAEALDLDPLNLPTMKSFHNCGVF